MVGRKSVCAGDRCVYEGESLSIPATPATCHETSICLFGLGSLTGRARMPECAGHAASAGSSPKVSTLHIPTTANPPTCHAAASPAVAVRTCCCRYQRCCIPTHPYQPTTQPTHLPCRGVIGHHSPELLLPLSEMLSAESGIVRRNVEAHAQSKRLAVPFGV
eukprot:366132-Chlamydomonas_euryale.AAC.9